MSDELKVTFPIEWVFGKGDEAAEEGEVDEVVRLQTTLADRGIAWTLVPDPRATTYWDQGKKAYALQGMKDPLSHDEAVAYLGLNT